MHEPYKIKSIRNVNYYSLSERKKFLRNVQYNIVRLPGSQVTFDLVTQGSSAMSQEQIGAFFLGDEAYAGARNFYTLNDIISKIFGVAHICPVHNRHGAIKLTCSVHVKAGNKICGNIVIPQEIISYYKGEYTCFPTTKKAAFEELDLAAVKLFLEKNKGTVPFIYIDPTFEGYKTLSLDNLKAIKKLADANGTMIILDASRIMEYAITVRKNTTALASKKLKEIVLTTTANAHLVIFDAGQDAMSNVGGFVGSNNAAEVEKYLNEVVLYEGLHTYGGMAGRTMEVASLGIREMADDLIAEWIDHQTTILESVLQKGSVPYTRIHNGVLLHCDKILDSQGSIRAHTIAVALYLTAGIRVVIDGPYQDENSLAILIPRRALLNSQIEQIAEAIISLYSQRKSIPALYLTNKPAYHYEADFGWLVPELTCYSFSSEPFIIHSIEHVGMKSRQERERAMTEAGYNTFLLKSEDVTIDLLTDSGTVAMSVEQWKKYLGAQETPAASDAYYDIIKTAQEIYGYKHIVLTHQGRAAEHIMSQMFIKPGDYVPGNMYFTTTKLHQELAGGTFVDIIIDEAHQTDSTFTWKGNIDLKKLDGIYKKAKEEGKQLSYISFEFNVNMAGGQPVSMDNIKEVYAYCRPLNIPVFFDATRCAENACFIQRKDPRYKNTLVKDILLEMFSYGDGATISSKKDMLTNLSGTLIFRDNEEWYKKALQMLQLFEGPYCIGGTSAGDMAAHAQGLREMVGDKYINNRIEQIAYFGKLLIDAGVPIVVPTGGHGVFLDAKKFLPHIDQDNYPAQMLAAQIFIETGVRAMERGNVSKGRDNKTGQNYRPKLELVRLTIPRRVYTHEHMKATAEGIIRLYSKRNEIKGLEFIYEPKDLRFFQGRFKPVK